MTGVERLASAFRNARTQKRAALVTYAMAGDPTVAASRALILACAEGGADVLEIGIPFSDPIADGPTLQLAAQRSLAGGTTLKRVLSVAREVRQRTTVPLVLMGYLNPVLAYGLERFVDDCVVAGVDGLILPDLPPDEAGELCALAAARGVAVVFLLAPTSTPARRAAVFRSGSGFVYFVSVTGVTGARTALPADLGARLEALRAESPRPVVVGFGVSTPAQARRLSHHADGVVVGSAIVSRVAQGGPVAARAARVRRFVRSLSAAMR